MIGLGLGLWRTGLSSAPAIPPQEILPLIEWDTANYPLTFSKASGVWGSSYNRSAYLPDSAFVTTYYVDRTNGSSGNSGLTAALPKSGIYQAITAGNATGSPYRVLIAPGDYERAYGFSNNGVTFPTQDCAFVANGSGRVITGTWDTALTWAGTKDGTYTNCTTTTRASVAFVRDRVNSTTRGDGVRFVNVADAATCDATANSWAQVGTTLYVNRGDGAVASLTNTRVYLSGVGSAFATKSATNGKKIYCKGIDFEGGTSIGAVAITSATVGVIGMFEDCTAKYAGNDASAGSAGAFDGFAVAGTGFYAFDRCRASACTKDGFNGHQATGSTRSTFILTNNCESYDVGLNAASNSNNGLTLHENVVGVDINGNYHHTRGRSVCNIDTTRQLLIGTRFGPDATGGGFDPTGVAATDTAIIYAADCTAAMASTSENAAVVSGTAHIYLRDFTSGGAVLVGTETMASNIVIGATDRTFRQPAMITSFGTGSGATFRLRGQARRKGYYVLVYAWNGVNTTMPTVPDGSWTTIETRSGSSMAALLAGRFYQDGDPISFTFANAGKVLYQAWSLTDASAPIRAFIGRTQNTAGLTLTYPALTRYNTARGTIFTRASGIRQTTAQVLPTGWHADSSTGSSAANIRWISPDTIPVTGNLTDDAVTLATNVQGMTWSLEMLGREDVAAPAYPWAKAPADGAFAAIGDSITAATGDISYHERAFAIGNVQLARNSGYNMGHSGWTTTQLVTQGSIVQTYAPSVIVLMAGTNDPANAISAATTQANLRTMIDQYNGYGAQVILATILPNNNGQEAHRTAVNDWIRAQTDVIVWDTTATGFDPSTHTSDGTHPNAAGATLLGGSLSPLLLAVDRL